MSRKLTITFILSVLVCVLADGQSCIVKEFTPVCDSLAVLLRERNTVDGELKLKAVMKRGSVLDFYFTESLGDYPWYKGDPQWFRSTLKELFPEQYCRYKVGEIYSRRVSIDRLVTPELKFNGNPSETSRRTKEPVGRSPFVSHIGSIKFDKGLAGRNIALWQSHGRYYEHQTDRWEWQRPCLFQTVEDMFTQGFVLPFLVPMLENAGAYVMLPRERDTRAEEVIVDNNPGWSRNGYTGSFGYGETGPVRGCGTYTENGRWSDAGIGFADPEPVYADDGSNPFRMGTARQTVCIPYSKKGNAEAATWRPDIPVRGRYAVYVSYKSLPQSTKTACYTIVHAGGSDRFVVNQRMGGGMWVYLGTFEFNAGSEGYVKIDNMTPKGWKHESGSIVTADAVRFGGGIGCIARGTSGTMMSGTTPVDSAITVSAATDCGTPDIAGVGRKRNWSVSGMPKSAEAARYWLQWSGADSTVFRQNEGINDYKDDFMSRGDWVAWLSGGSDMNSGKPGKKIPVDLALGFHSDAGVTPNDSIVGTLAIYTLKSEGKIEYPSGEHRMTSRDYADIVQSQIVNDLRQAYTPLWSRRQIWDRAYRESRTPTCPSMLLELLSHQNFADMRYGLDPSFRFTVGRAVYKGMLKYLSNRYGCPYVVQPLPVEAMAVGFANEDDGIKAVLSWEPVKDPVEPTAEADGYILYTRIDDGAFDSGRIVTEPVVSQDGTVCIGLPIEAGRIYSYKIVAYNSGGKSFPSETVSIGTPKSNSKTVLIVNNFDRTSGPAFFDTPDYAGFDNRLDSGVPYISDITFIGEMYQFRRGLGWADDDNPGFGASYTDYAGKSVAGNTFDYASIHGKAIMEAGYPFCSCSSKAFVSNPAIREGIWSVDLICGKQVTTVIGEGAVPARHTVFPLPMQETLTDFTSKGGNVMVSGAHIGTDIWDEVFPAPKDSTFSATSKAFASKILGYRWMTNYASRTGTVKSVPSVACSKDFSLPYDAPHIMEFHNTPNPDCYCVETPDGIVPASVSSHTISRYTDTGISAAVRYEGNGYRTACYGFPIETLKDSKDISIIISETLDFFNR